MFSSEMMMAGPKYPELRYLQNSALSLQLEKYTVYPPHLTAPLRAPLVTRRVFVPLVADLPDPLQGGEGVSETGPAFLILGKKRRQSCQALS